MSALCLQERGLYRNGGGARWRRATNTEGVQADAWDMADLSIILCSIHQITFTTVTVPAKHQDRFRSHHAVSCVTSASQLHRNTLALYLWILADISFTVPNVEHARPRKSCPNPHKSHPIR